MVGHLGDSAVWADKVYLKILNGVIVFLICVLLVILYGMGYARGLAGKNDRSLTELERVIDKELMLLECGK